MVSNSATARVLSAKEVATSPALRGANSKAIATPFTYSKVFLTCNTDEPLPVPIFHARQPVACNQLFRAHKCALAKSMT